MAKYLNASIPWAWDMQGSPEPSRIMGHGGPDASLLSFSQLLNLGLNSYAHTMCFVGLLAFLKTYFGKLQSLLENHFS